MSDYKSWTEGIRWDDHISEIYFGAVLDFADQIHNLLRELKKQK